MLILLAKQLDRQHGQVHPSRRKAAQLPKQTPAVLEITDRELKRSFLQAIVLAW